VWQRKNNNNNWMGYDKTCKSGAIETRPPRLGPPAAQQQPIIRFLICPHGAFRKESEIDADVHVHRKYKKKK
jgi:hypothetical protein